MVVGEFLPFLEPAPITVQGKIDNHVTLEP